MGKRFRELVYRFDGATAPPATGSSDSGPFVTKITAAGGSPTIAPAGRGLALTLDNTNEVQNLCLYQDDKLAFDIDQLISVEILAKITASLPATVTAILGLASARNDDPDVIAQAALFKLAGSNSVVVETDDGTTNNDDLATGLSLSTTERKFRIDFGEGVHTQSPPALSLGGKANVLFSMENSAGLMRRVAENTRFDMSGYSGALQLIAQLQKSAATDVATLTVGEFRVKIKDN